MAEDPTTRSPTTNLPLESRHLVSNLDKRGQLDVWRATRDMAWADELAIVLGGACISKDPETLRRHLKRLAECDDPMAPAPPVKRIREVAQAAGLEIDVGPLEAAVRKADSEAAAGLGVYEAALAVAQEVADEARVEMVEVQAIRARHLAELQRTNEKLGELERAASDMLRVRDEFKAGAAAFKQRLGDRRTRRRSSRPLFAEAQTAFYGLGGGIIDEGRGRVLAEVAADGGDHAAVAWCTANRWGRWARSTCDPVMLWRNVVATTGCPLAMTELAMETIDPHESTALIQRAAGLGCERAFWLAGWRLVGTDPEAAIILFEQAPGHPFARFKLGVCHDSGVGTPVDRARAASLWLAASAQGCELAMYNLANCYHLGDGVEADGQQSAYWLDRCVKAGDRDAIYEMGMRYMSGCDVALDLARGVRLVYRAAQLGQPAACSFIGI